MSCRQSSSLADALAGTGRFTAARQYAQEEYGDDA
jgi:hypothetical protein